MNYSVFLCILLANKTLKWETDAFARTVYSDSIEKVMESANSASYHSADLSTNAGAFNREL